MKCKKALSFLLAMVMVLGLLPVSAMAAGTEIGTSTNGEFVDTNADPNKSYEYTVTGSDGSTQTVVVPAVGAAETGNSVKPQDIPGEVYYQKVTNPANANGEGYLLVDTKTKQAVTHIPGVKTVKISKNGNRIIGDHADAEWKVTTSTGKIRFETETNRLTISQTKEGNGNHAWLIFPDDPWKNFRYSVEVGSNTDNFEPVISGNSFKLFRDYNERAYNDDPAKMVSVYLNIEGTNVMGDKNVDHATSFTLFQKKTVSAGTQYTVNTDGLDALLAKSFVESQYTTDSWKTYADAKAAAETAKKALKNPYTEKTAADAALADIDSATRNLDAAIKGLTKKPVKPVEPGTCVKPEITWHRTWENNTYGEKPVQNVQHLVDKDPWLDITWDWNQINGLTASDPNPWNNGHAATWSKGYGGNWTDSSVRRFTGTFTWPAGVGMDGSMTVQSVNDANYQFIYDYINQPGNEELAKRYGNAKVLPINDDMYVFISKVSDGEPSTWDKVTAKKHLAFWTGTSGKGIWSKNRNTGNDWSRTTPARFQGISATPAYYGSWPNLVDTGAGTNADVQDWKLNGQANPMTHSDSWYTLTDSSALMSKLNELYGATANLGGEKMRIDVYAFDNSGDGGMDELELVLCAAKQTTAQVQVNYWLDNVGATSLGSTVMTKNIGETVNLANGTNTNELNHKKAEAIRIAGAAADVSNGTQVEKDFVVQKDGNVINVVYTRKIQGVKYFTYDFGVQNQYIYSDKNTASIKNVRVECKTDTIGASFSGHNITLTYTPKDALGSFVQATLVVERKNSTNRYEIGFIPASNVLYEENFITGDWSKTDHAAMTVSDNGDNVYGHTAAYKTSVGANGEYTATVSASKQKTSDLKFSFRGLGLDLIGSCGPNYGTQVVKIMQGNSVVKAFVVNTAHKTELHQVPLLHTQKGLLAGSQYDVTVRGLYVAPAKGMSTMSADSTMTRDVYEALLDMGLTKNEIMTKVEFVNVADNLEKAPENGFSVMSNSVAPMVATDSQTVAVDGFRVYRSTEKAAVAYAKNEQNLIYTNVMDEAITGNFHAYVEGDAQGEFNTAIYEGKGGPQNELYLKSGTGIVFGAEGATYAQVSLRAVNGATEYNHNAISHNTEMYYEVTVENGMITIANTGDQMLAIGNLKTNGKITTISDKDRAVQAVAMMFAAPVEPEVFVPQTLTGKVSALPMGKYKMYTVKVKASTDVDKLTIDGKTVRPSNKLLVKLGLAKEYEFRMSKKVLRTEPAVFDVVAYDANGVASKPVQFSK